MGYTKQGGGLGSHLVQAFQRHGTTQATTQRQGPACWAGLPAVPIGSLALPPIPVPGRGLTEFPAAHVVELRAQQQCGDDVDDGEENPEHHVAFAKDLWGEDGVSGWEAELGLVPRGP